MPSSKMSKVKVCSVILPGQEDLKETLVFKIRSTFFYLNKIWKTSNPILHFIINDPKQVLIIDNSAVDETIFFYSKCCVIETMRCSLFQTKLKRHLPTRSCELYGFGLSCELYGVGLCFSQICLRMFLVLGLI